MTSMELLELMGQVKGCYVQEAHSNVVTYKRRVSMKRSVMIALIAALMLMLVGCALVIMKLQELKVGDYSYNHPGIPNVVEPHTITKDLLSMQGYEESVNYQAAKEWREFLDNYDTDGTLLANAQTDDYQESIEYMAYPCYTQEMQDKIDEICDKYDLEILGPCYTEKYAMDVVVALGIDNLFADTNSARTVLTEGYYYAGGTFQISGESTMDYEGSPWIYPVSYQYRCVMKNAFDEVALPVDDVESFEQWNYRLQDGSDVLLVLSKEQAVILVDKEDFFITINVMNPVVGDIQLGEMQMSREGLEAFAETFSFDYTITPPDPESLTPPEWYTESGGEAAEPEGNTGTEEYTEEYIASKVYEYFVSGDRSLLEESQAKLWWIPDFQDDTLEYEYTYLDLDGDGLDELLIQMKDDPSGYNGVIHYENGKLICWNSDASEMSSRDYPLNDGTMVRQYDYNGTRTYTIFQYDSNGEREEISCLYAVDELMMEGSNESCPYYKIDGEEVTATVFEEMLEKMVISKMLERTSWTQISSK